jgi:hypothetical protein
MTSEALDGWRTTGRGRIDEMLALHRDATGAGQGRRWGTQQLNQAMHIALLAQFQKSCLSLHDEAVSVHVQAANSVQRGVIQQLMTQGRKLERNAPRPDHLGSDFARLGVPVVQLLKLNTQAANELVYLGHLADFRNAIGHGNEDEARTIADDATVEPRIRSTKRSVTTGRRVLDRLAGRLDDLVANELGDLLATTRPW